MSDSVPGQGAASDQDPPPTLAQLDDVLGVAQAQSLRGQGTFEDSEGLISFVTLSSSLVNGSSAFGVGRAVCDRIINFYATLRGSVYEYLRRNPSKLLPGDTPPITKWDPAVTHYLQFVLHETPGLARSITTTQTYRQTVLLSEFGAAFVQHAFDAQAVPEAAVIELTKFVQYVGTTLRVNWDDKSRSFGTAVLAQCHEAVQVDGSGNNLVYLPKIKYYYVAAEASQRAFTSSCGRTERIAFNFQYEYYVTALRASVLDGTSSDYKSFVALLDKAQSTDYREANNTVDVVLGQTASTPEGTNPFGVDYAGYPRVNLA
jgi:hypothetical protein